MQYSLNEICILPSAKPTNISSRSQVNPYDENRKLPIFVAPMTSVINSDNIKIFDNYNVIPILPRNVEFRLEKSILYWTAFSLQEFIHYFNACNAPELENGYYHVLIDVANGHMENIYIAVRDAKQEYGDHVKIMIGNIAHPDMYVECCKAGVDYVRVGIGGGSVCSTSVQCGIHASHQWMIEGIKKIKDCKTFMGIPTSDFNWPKVIADGGINTLDKAIKALAIGYDYVMMGKCFAECEEACGETKEINCQKQYPQVAINAPVGTIDPVYWEGIDIPGTGQLIRKYYGMASEQGQIDISGGATKNPEGIETWIPVTTTLEAFTTRFEAALRSTMSYTGSHTLEEFHNAKYDIQSIEEFKSYYK